MTKKEQHLKNAKDGLWGRTVNAMPIFEMTKKHMENSLFFILLDDKVDQNIKDEYTEKFIEELNKVEPGDVMISFSPLIMIFTSPCGVSFFLA